MSKPKHITIKCDRFRLQVLAQACAEVAEMDSESLSAIDRLVALCAIDICVSLNKKLCEPRSEYKVKLSARDAAALQLAIWRSQVVAGGRDAQIAATLVSSQIHQTYC